MTVWQRSSSRGCSARLAYAAAVLAALLTIVAC